MQRLGLSVRRCRNFKIRSSCGRCSSFSSGSEHDDYWTAAKTEAQTTPAYQQATAAAAATSDTPPPPAGGDLWATPGNYTARRMPMGDAYGPSSSSRAHESRSMRSSPDTNSFNTELNRERPPAFDMESPMHLSPFKQVDVRPFMGQTLVDIRQYYTSPGGATLPSKKGISLTLPQWRRLQAAMREIEGEIEATERNLGGHQNGEERPGGQAL